MIKHKKVEIRVCDFCGQEQDKDGLVGVMDCYVCGKQVCFICGTPLEYKGKGYFICPDHIPERIKANAKG